METQPKSIPKLPKGVHLRSGRFYVRFRGPSGWRTEATTCTPENDPRGKAAARIRRDLEVKAERIRHGLEIPRVADDGRTLAHLVQWWIDRYKSRGEADDKSMSSVRRHVLGDRAFAGAPLSSVDTALVTRWMRDKLAEAAICANTINHLRNWLVAAFNRAREEGIYRGDNPASGAATLPVDERIHMEILALDEIDRFLASAGDDWRDLLAVAIYTGLRKGELFALQRSDLDFAARRITVRRSHGADTTKGGHHDVIPMPSAVVPFLMHALEGAPGLLVFPAPGKGDTRRKENVATELIVRRTMARAGLVTGWVHRCRGCQRTEATEDSSMRSCVACRDPMWASGVPRPMRFHDLRHTCASLLLMQGVDLIAVQKILRHRDPKLTARVYGHLRPDYLQTEIDKLSDAVARLRPPFHRVPPSHSELVTAPLQGFHERGLTMQDDAVFLPPVVQAHLRTNSIPPIALSHSESLGVGFPGVDAPPQFHRVPPSHSEFVTGPLQGPSLPVYTDAIGTFYTPAQVAALFKISLQSVRGLLRRGCIEHRRIGRNVRISADSLRAFLDAGGERR